MKDLGYQTNFLQMSDIENLNKNQENKNTAVSIVEPKIKKNDF